MAKYRDRKIASVSNARPRRIMKKVARARWLEGRVDENFKFGATESQVVVCLIFIAADPTRMQDKGRDL